MTKMTKHHANMQNSDVLTEAAAIIVLSEGTQILQPCPSCCTDDDSDDNFDENDGKNYQKTYKYAK